MLYNLLGDVCQHIDRLDIKAQTPHMLGQIERARPDLRSQLAQHGGNPDALELILQAIAAGALMCIKGIPRIGEFLAGRTRSRGVSPQVRCAIAGVLAYLVQPRDLIPDDAPGGYGYLDDSVILRAGLVEYLKMDPAPEFDLEEEEKHINMVASLVPPAVLPALQVAVGSMSTAFQLMSILPATMAEFTLQQIVANPLQAAAPAAPPGFNPNPAPSYGGGRWSGGAYFEGGNVVVPGGPSLIDGNLFIPD